MLVSASARYSVLAPAVTALILYIYIGSFLSVIAKKSTSNIAHVCMQCNGELTCSLVLALYTPQHTHRHTEKLHLRSTTASYDSDWETRVHEPEL